jgi:hypothetical protein
METAEGPNVRPSQVEALSEVWMFSIWIVG